MGIKLFCYLLVFAAISSLSSCGCNRVEPNHEGVQSSNFARSRDDFKFVKGYVGTLYRGQKLYQVPMYSQTGELNYTTVTSRDGQEFTIHPHYRYKATEGHGIDIIFNYMHVGDENDSEAFLDSIEAKVLDPLVYDAFRTVARTFSTDSLVNNMAVYEAAVEAVVKTDFAEAHFDLLKGLSSSVKPPKSMDDAIEARNNVDQKIGQVKKEIELEKAYLQKAEIQAQTNKVASSGLTREVLLDKHIDMLKHTSNKVIITDGKTPVIFNAN